MVLAELGNRLHSALNQLSRASAVDEKASLLIPAITLPSRPKRLFCADYQVIDALLKELCAALLESDVNVKLVSQLRAKIKAKVKKNLEEAEKAGGREANKKNVVQKVSCKPLDSDKLTCRRCLMSLWHWLIRGQSLISLSRERQTSSWLSVYKERERLQPVQRSVSRTTRKPELTASLLSIISEEDYGLV